MQPVGGFTEDSSSATAINNIGQVVGSGDTAPGYGNGRRAFLWDEVSGSQLLPLDVDGTIHEASRAYDINDLGAVVGQIYPSDNSYALAILWQGSEASDLGSLGGTHAFAYGINESSVVVGHSDASGSTYGHAFIWNEEQGMRDLNELIDPALGIELVSAHAINNNGWILAEAQFIGHTILLKPIPEPGIATLLLTGTLCLPFVFCKRLSRIFC